MDKGRGASRRAFRTSTAAEAEEIEIVIIPISGGPSVRIMTTTTGFDVVTMNQGAQSVLEGFINL